MSPIHPHYAMWQSLVLCCEQYIYIVCFQFICYLYFRQSECQIRMNNKMMQTQWAWIGTECPLVLRFDDFMACVHKTRIHPVNSTVAYGWADGGYILLLLLLHIHRISFVKLLWRNENRKRFFLVFICCYFFAFKCCAVCCVLVYVTLFTIGIYIQGSYKNPLVSIFLLDLVRENCDWHFVWTFIGFQ